MESTILQSILICGGTWFLWKLFRRFFATSTLDNVPGPTSSSFLYGAYLIRNNLTYDLFVPYSHPFPYRKLQTDSEHERVGFPSLSRREVAEHCHALWLLRGTLTQDSGFVCWLMDVCSGQDAVHIRSDCAAPHPGQRPVHLRRDAFLHEVCLRLSSHSFLLLIAIRSHDMVLGPSLLSTLGMCDFNYAPDIPIDCRRRRTTQEAAQVAQSHLLDQAHARHAPHLLRCWPTRTSASSTQTSRT